MNRLPTTLSISSPCTELESLDLDLSLAYQAEAKLGELATASSGNACHLAAVYSRAYNQLGQAYGRLYQEAGVATVVARKRRAVIILDLAAGIAKEKGLASARSPTGSEDVREAICYADEQYCKIEKYRAAVEAAKELVSIKLQAFKMAFYAVQSILKGTSSSAGNGFYDMSNPEEGTLMDNALASVQRAETSYHDDSSSREGFVKVQPRGFGKPKY